MTPRVPASDDPAPALRARRGALRSWPGPFLAALFIAAFGVAPRASAEPPLRVLLVEGAKRIEAGGLVLRAGPDGGLLAGDEVLGPVWRSRGRGPHRAGELRVRGALEVQRTAGGLRLVNRVSVEDYVAGTLGREIYPRWDAETLKAQAVVTRTYAEYQRARRVDPDYDLLAGTSHQVYGGADAETPAIRAAVESTRGQVLLHGGRPILAAFHSSSGGRTASAEEVWGEPIAYLLSVTVQDEQDSPDTYWRARVSGTTLGRSLVPLGHRLGEIRGLRIAERSDSGRVRQVVLEGTDGSSKVTGRALRAALGASVIRSTLFEIRPAEDGFVFVGSGHGHGVGMSQWGAQAMAQRGSSYRDILATFYPGTTLAGPGTR